MSLHAVFSPTSIAVIGASTQPGTVGNDIVKNLSRSFKGKLYPINPKGGELYGLPVFDSVTDVPHPIELVIVCVPAAIVSEVLVEAGKKKIKAAVVISAGFKEVGNSDLEEKVVAISKKYGFTLVGPNCLGVLNPHIGMNGSFAPTMPEAGSIAFLSQSGALGVAVLDYAKTSKIGISKFLSVGNKAALSESELLQYLAHDPQTKVILLYVEQLSDFSSILKVAHTIRRNKHPKPIIVLKSGKTDAGAKAASSHTGALMGNTKLYEALFRQAGIIQANTIEELFLFAECFNFSPLLKKDRVAVVTNAGGLGVLLTDALVREKLNLAQVSEKTKKELTEFLPVAASVHNPFDILGDANAERYKKTLDIVIKDENVDALAILLTPQSMTEVAKTAQIVVSLKKKNTKPIIVSFLGGERVKEAIGILHTGKVPDLNFPESIATGLGILHSFSIWKADDEKPKYFRDIDHQKVHEILDKKANQNNWLSQVDVLEILEAYNLPVLPWAFVKKSTELGYALQICEGKAVYKIVSDQIIHKSEVGGVVINVTPENAQTEYAQLLQNIDKKAPDAKIDGVLVMQQLEKKGMELIVGGVRDKHLGAIIGCGMGGIFTETFNDASFALAPLSKNEIEDSISRLKIAPILRGTRGQKPYDLTAITECMARLSQLMEQYPQIAEIDINPVVVFPASQGIEILDARIRTF
jgi:acetyltransferase